MRKVMVIGAVEAGKTSLVFALLGEDEAAKKTQSLTYRDFLIDTPGEYSENPLFYRSLMATSMEACAVLLVHDATRDRNYFPPGFASGFPVPTIGAITKIDHSVADVKRAIKLLRQAIPEGEIYLTSAIRGEGIAELKRRLLNFTSPQSS